MKFKNRSKQRDKSLPEMAEDIERLSKLLYHDVPPTLRDVLARDQFVDALPKRIPAYESSKKDRQHCEEPLKLHWSTNIANNL